MDYDKHFAVFYDIKLMIAEVFAKGLGKCRPLTRLLGQNLETMDDYGCPKFQELVGEGKAESSWISSIYPFRQNTRLHCADRKAKLYGEWVMQHLILSILYVFIVFVFTTNSILSTRNGFSYSIQFCAFQTRCLIALIKSNWINFCLTIKTLKGSRGIVWDKPVLGL